MGPRGALSMLLLVLASTQGLSPTFVITGGPCSGKTTAIEGLEARGWTILKVPEASTMQVHRGGLRPFNAPLDLSGRYTHADRVLLWEAWLNELKISLENGAHTAAQQRPEGAQQVAVVADRGVIDSRAYLTDDSAWLRMLELGGWDEAELLCRYNHVLHLEVAPEQHYNTNNAARTETYPEALDLAAATFSAWDTMIRRTGCAHRVSHDRVSNGEVEEDKYRDLYARCGWYLAQHERNGLGTAARLDQERMHIPSGGQGGTEGTRQAAEVSSKNPLSIEFVLEEMNAVAGSRDLSVVFPRSQRLLRNVQNARRRDASLQPSQPLSSSSLSSLGWLGEDRHQQLRHRRYHNQAVALGLPTSASSTGSGSPGMQHGKRRSEAERQRERESVRRPSP